MIWEALRNAMRPRAMPLNFPTQDKGLTPFGAPKAPPPPVPVADLSDETIRRIRGEGMPAKKSDERQQAATTPIGEFDMGEPTERLGVSVFQVGAGAKNVTLIPARPGRRIGVFGLELLVQITNTGSLYLIFINPDGSQTFMHNLIGNINNWLVVPENLHFLSEPGAYLRATINSAGNNENAYGNLWYRYSRESR